MKRLYHKLNISHRVEWGLVPHLISGRRKACRYVRSLNRGFLHWKYGCILDRLLRQPLKSCSLLTLCCLLTLLLSMAPARGDEQQLTVYTGVTMYNNPEYDSVVLVEFPFSLNRHEFEFYRPDSTDSNLYARIFAQVHLFDSTGVPIDSTSTFFSVRVASKEEAGLTIYRIFNKLALFAKPGPYSSRLTVIDAVTKRTGEFLLDKFTVDPIEKQRITIGGTCLAYRLKYVGEQVEGANVRLVKNGFEVTPNPLSVFSTDDDVIHLYGEVYNLAYSEEQPSKYELSFTALDTEENIFRDIDDMLLIKPGSTAVIAESFDISTWSPGRYFLRIIALDHTVNESDTTLVPFRIISPEEIRLAFQRARSFDPYDTLSIDMKVNLVAYLLNPEQKATLARLTDTGKLNFLSQYWRENDEDPTTKIVENRLEFIERYVFCNRNFSTNENKTDGWATYRGRIYMTYGQWDEIDDRQAPLLGNPYQIWYYRGIKEGKVFVFEDWTGTDEFRLVHSNVYGEIYSQKWQDRLDQGLPDLPIEH